jgi:hypothetical protein
LTVTLALLRDSPTDASWLSSGNGPIEVEAGAILERAVVVSGVFPLVWCCEKANALAPLALAMMLTAIRATFRRVLIIPLCLF